MHPAHSRAGPLPVAGNKALCQLIEEGMAGLLKTLGPDISSRPHGSNLNVRNLNCPCSSCFTAVKIRGSSRVYRRPRPRMQMMSTKHSYTPPRS